MDAASYRAALAKKLDERLEALRAETGRANVWDAWESVAADPEKCADVIALAVKLFAYATVFDVEWPDGEPDPSAPVYPRKRPNLYGEDAARAIVASLLFSAPRPCDQWGKKFTDHRQQDFDAWRVSFPYLFGDKSDARTPTEQRNWRAAMEMARLIGEGVPRKIAKETVAKQIGREARTAEAAYDAHKTNPRIRLAKSQTKKRKSLKLKLRK